MPTILKPSGNHSNSAQNVPISSPNFSVSTDQHSPPLYKRNVHLALKVCVNLVVHVKQNFTLIAHLLDDPHL